MKKFIRKNLKIMLAIFATAVICISGTIFATYQYQASQVEYNGQSVESALNELYNSKNNITYEEGEFSQYVQYNGNYAFYTINLEKTYSEEDNARLIIKEITEPNAMYYSSDAITHKVIGNTILITLLNYAGESSYSKTYNVKYKIIRDDDMQ